MGSSSCFPSTTNKGTIKSLGVSWCSWSKLLMGDELRNRLFRFSGYIIINLVDLRFHFQKIQGNQFSFLQ